MKVQYLALHGSSRHTVLLRASLLQMTPSLCLFVEKKQLARDLEDELAASCGVPASVSARPKYYLMCPTS